MFDSRALDEFLRKVNSMVSNSPVAGMEKNARAMMMGFFSNMDLVTREEFDAQAAVLASTRQRLYALEQRLRVLEEQGQGAEVV
ncbi:MAG: accessory factor UbiK family protein [Betaproteobacteria bacterium]|nr:accessory factor UbiK family protein [Betaproteobacteria bacterium]